jgi:hypothetical protein
MDFPPDWKVDDMEDFDIAVATLAESDDAVAVELLAQLRPNGRILDNFRSYSIPSTGQLTSFWMRPPTRGSRFVAIPPQTGRVFYRTRT